METNPSTTQNIGNILSGAGTWIILGVVVVIIIIFLIYSSIKNKMKKNKMKKDKIEFENRASYFKKIYLAKLKVLIDKNNQLIQEFEPSIGEYKMGQIVDVAHKFLNTFASDKNFKEYIVNADSQNDLLSLYIQLRDTRSNLWNKKIENVLQRINQLIETNFIDNTSNEYQEALTEINLFYTMELQKNE
ncbi:hypothetical protein VBM87_00155 [Mycoplasma sp. 744]|uniref:MHJ_0274 family protein n=1 Tax=unclassified Mycoplasma TaxID=2683645 RepID=UPI00211B74C5|nr:MULTISPECIES: hypothetical protein [unclassified Mycoplasma]MEA4115203.1 hypothetical protein [Mycoplasma sp. 744]UUM19208.1 hypothetical protein NPA14_02665 [Mycoplasma sp. 1018B]